SVSLAQRSQENDLTRASPYCDIERWMLGLSSTVRIDWANSCRSPLGSTSSTYWAAAPNISDSDELLAATRGTPQAIASNGGSPKPSYSDGNTKSEAAL